MYVSMFVCVNIIMGKYTDGSIHACDMFVYARARSVSVHACESMIANR